MCGIAGYYVRENDRVDAKTLQQLARNLLSEIETRGRDATGYAYVSVRDKTVRLAKAPVPASQFLHVGGHLLTRASIKSMPKAMILHTRAATQGDPSDNRNNHPLFSKRSSLCMVHNGWISNDSAILREFKLDQDAAVDSEVYLRLIEHMYYTKTPGSMESAVIAATKKVYGSLACAMIQGGRSDTLWVWKDTGALYMVEMDWGWVFASTKDAVLKSVLGACHTINGIIAEYIDPMSSTMYTITNRGVGITTGVIGGTWQQTSRSRRRTTKVWKDGKLTEMTTSGGARIWSMDGWDDYDEDGYEYTGYAPGYSHSIAKDDQDHQSRLFNMADRRAEQANAGTTGVTDIPKYARQDDPIIPASERSAWRDKFKKSAPKECFCRDDYVCTGCRTRGMYYGHTNKCKFDDVCKECKDQKAFNEAAAMSVGNAVARGSEDLVH